MARTISSTTVSSISLLSADTPVTLIGSSSFSNNATITITGTSPSATTAGFGSYFGIYGGAGTTWTLTNKGTLTASGSQVVTNGNPAQSGNRNAAIGIGGAGGSSNAAGTIVNATGGLITSVNRGVVLYGDGLVVNQAGATITAAGLAVGMVGATNTVQNSGVISGGVVIARNTSDLDPALRTAVVTNTGTISGGIALQRKLIGTVTNSGLVTAAASGTAAATGIAVSTTAALILSNATTGTITGMNGVSVSGSTTSASTISNAGQIVGASTIGVLMAAGSNNTIDNSGTITGVTVGVSLTGAGSTLSNQSGGTITGATGVLMSATTGTIVNAGRITATTTGVTLTGSGIVVTNAATGIVVGTTTGIQLGAAGQNLTNLGSITGTSGVIIGAAVGDATVTNRGTITATDTSAGYAVRFARTSATNRLITNTDGVIGGKIKLGTGVLELATGTASGGGTISGLGSIVLSVGTIAIDTGAKWQVGGASAGFNGVQINGFDNDDRLVLTDFVAVSDTFTGTSLILTDGLSNQQTIAMTGTFTTSDVILTTGAGATTVSLLCFCQGTVIDTPTGRTAVQNLRVGDRVMTASGAVRPITWIGQASVALRRGKRTDATPVLIRAGAFAPNVPFRDLRVTKGHAFYLDGALIPVEFLINNRSILWDDNASHETLFHIELDAHDIVLANGAPAESYRDDGNRPLFATQSHDAMPRHDPCAPILLGGPVVDAVWARLLARAGTGSIPLTDDPDLDLPRKSGGPLAQFIAIISY